MTAPGRVRSHVAMLAGLASILATLAGVATTQGQQTGRPVRYGLSRVASGPLPIRCQQADLVVVGTCTKANPAKEMELKEPGNRSASKRHFRQYEVAVSEVIKAPASSTTQPAAGEPGKEPVRLTVFARAAQPVDPNGPLRPTLYRRPVVNLVQSRKYVLILHKLPGRDGMFVQTPANCVPADDADLDRYRLAAQPDRWGWGKEHEGLQLAVWLDRQEFGYVKNPRDPKAPPIYITGVLTLRNTGKHTRKVLLNPTDKPFAMEAIDPKGKTSALEVYPSHIRRKTWVMLSVAPGELVFLTPYGKAGRSAMGVVAKLTPDTYKLTASLTARLPEDVDQHERQPDLWAGAIRSKPVEFSLKKISLKRLQERRKLPPQGVRTAPSRNLPARR